jgi:hypothetical protein
MERLIVFCVELACNDSSVMHVCLSCPCMQVAGWQQQWRIPAFGEWNYGVDGDTPGLTPCFDVVAVRMTNALAARKPNEVPTTNMHDHGFRVRFPCLTSTVLSTLNYSKLPHSYRTRQIRH